MISRTKIIIILCLFIGIGAVMSCSKMGEIGEGIVKDENYEEDKISLINNEEITFLNNSIKAKTEEILSENDFKSEDVINIADEDFRVVLKKLCRRQAANCDYEIYATDNENYALVLVSEDSFKTPYWLYKNNKEWHIEYLTVPEPYCVGNVDNVEFYELPGLEATLLIVQDVSNMGNGSTYVFQIVNNEVQCVGASIEGVRRNRATWADSDRTDFYANEGRTQIAFKDINYDGKEELLVYARKLIYACTPAEIQELLEVETVKWAYLFQDGNFVKMENSEFIFDGNLIDTNLRYYHLWGISADVSNQVLEIIEEDGTGTLYSLNWIDEKSTIENIPIIGNEIYKTEISQKEEGKAGFYVITEQVAERSRIYQVFLWESGELREVFIDEYRDYSLIDEETYLTGDQYNTYRCVINGDVLIMKGARLLMDAEGNVCGVETEPRKFQYVNGYFEPVENTE